MAWMRSGVRSPSAPLLGVSCVRRCFPGHRAPRSHTRADRRPIHSERPSSPDLAASGGRFLGAGLFRAVRPPGCRAAGTRRLAATRLGSCTSGSIMRFNALAAAVALAVPTAAFSLACAVPDLPPDETQDEQASTDPTRSKTPAKRGTTTPPSTSTGTSAGSGSSTPSAGTPASAPDASAPPPTNTCGTASTADACFRCCDVAHPNAMPLLSNEWGACQCKVPGVCASACASSYCAGQGVLQGSSCDNCLAANDQTCSTKADIKCAADTTCQPYLTCTTDAKCASKPL